MSFHLPKSSFVVQLIFIVLLLLFMHIYRHTPTIVNGISFKSVSVYFVMIHRNTMVFAYLTIYLVISLNYFMLRVFQLILLDLLYIIIASEVNKSLSSFPIFVVLISISVSSLSTRAKIPK